MAEEIGFEYGRNSKFQGLVTLTLTLDPAIRHTVVHHSSTSTCIPNFIKIEETFCGRTDGRTDVPFSALYNIIRSTFGSRPKMEGKTSFSRRRKQFDGLTWLTLSPAPIFYDRFTPLNTIRRSLTHTGSGSFQIWHADSRQVAKWLYRRTGKFSDVSWTNSRKQSFVYGEVRYPSGEQRKECPQNSAVIGAYESIVV